MKEQSFVQYILEKEGIVLPSFIFKSEILKELDKKLLSKRPILVSQFLNKFAKNIKNNIDFKKIDESIKLIENFNKNLKRVTLTEEDEKILYFLKKEEFFKLEDFLNLIGPIYQLLLVIEDLKKIQSKNLKMFITISSFVYLYELTLYNIDRKIYYYLNKKKKKEKLSKIEENFLKEVNRNINTTDHATAGSINKVLSSILKINENNNSIFRIKTLRNKIAHANLFYDSYSNKIIVGKEILEINDFYSEFYRLLKFNIRWLELSANSKTEHLQQNIINNIVNALQELSKLFLIIERQPELKKAYGQLILTWKKEYQK